MFIVSLIYSQKTMDVPICTVSSVRTLLIFISQEDWEEPLLFLYIVVIILQLNFPIRKVKSTMIFHIFFLQMRLQRAFPKCFI